MISKIRHVRILSIRQHIKERKFTLAKKSAKHPFHSLLTLSPRIHHTYTSNVVPILKRLTVGQSLAFCFNISAQCFELSEITFNFQFYMYKMLEDDRIQVFNRDEKFFRTGPEVVLSKLTEQDKDLVKYVESMYIKEIKSLENVLRLACAKVTGISEINDKQIFAFETESDLSHNMCYGSVYRL